MPNPKEPPVEAQKANAPTPAQNVVSEPNPAPEAWEEFLEEEADCCGGCHHKPR